MTRNELLLAVDAAIKELDIFKSVFTTELLDDDEGDLIPKNIRFPACGITDGGEDPPMDGTAGSLTRLPIVLVAVYAQAQLNREPGEALLSALALAEQVFRHLHRNLLGREEITLAHYQGAQESDLVEFRQGLASRLVMAIRYEMEEGS